MPAEVLTGSQLVRVHPKFVAEKEGLRLVKSKLGSGLILTGASDKVEESESLSVHAHHISRGVKILPSGSTVQ